MYNDNVSISVFLGRIFGESSVKLIIIALLQRFKLTTTTEKGEIEYEPGFTVGKNGGSGLGPKTVSRKC